MHEGSVADGDLVDHVFETFRPTHVIHSAAAYKDPDDWLEDVASNVAGTINVARAARKAGVRRLVNFQTALCYGRPAAVPIPVDAPVAPFTSYGISKAGGRTLPRPGGTARGFAQAGQCNRSARLAIGPIPTFYKRLKGREAVLLFRNRARLPRHARFPRPDAQGAGRWGRPPASIMFSTGHGKHDQGHFRYRCGLSGN